MRPRHFHVTETLDFLSETETNTSPQFPETETRPRCYKNRSQDRGVESETISLYVLLYAEEYGSVCCICV